MLLTEDWLEKCTAEIWMGLLHRVQVLLLELERVRNRECEVVIATREAWRLAVPLLHLSDVLAWSTASGARYDAGVAAETVATLRYLLNSLCVAHLVGMGRWRPAWIYLPQNALCFLMVWCGKINSLPFCNAPWLFVEEKMVHFSFCSLIFLRSQESCLLRGCMCLS